MVWKNPITEFYSREYYVNENSKIGKCLKTYFELPFSNPQDKSD